MSLRELIITHETPRWQNAFIELVAPAPKLFELEPVLARVLHAPITRIELGFSPDRILPAARPAHEYTESPLFVRGDFALPAQRFKFPHARSDLNAPRLHQW